MPKSGYAAAKMALPHPPKTNQKVPKNSAKKRFINKSFKINNRLIHMTINFERSHKQVKKINIFKLYLCKKLDIIMKLLIITLVLLGLRIAGISIKLWAKKDGKFAGTCASQNPMLNSEGEACGFCGKTPDQFRECDVQNH